MQPSIGSKVCNLLGDERMSDFDCDCGTKMPRMPSHRTELIGCTCTWCRTKWKTHAVVDEDGQTKLWYMYFKCTCGSHPLNRPPKLTSCICEVGELR